MSHHYTFVNPVHHILEGITYNFRFQNTVFDFIYKKYKVNILYFKLSLYCLDYLVGYFFKNILNVIQKRSTGNVSQGLHSRWNYCLNICQEWRPGQQSSWRWPQLQSGLQKPGGQQPSSPESLNTAGAQRPLHIPTLAGAARARLDRSGAAKGRKELTDTALGREELTGEA